MYLAIIVLPLLGSIVSGFFGRKVGVSGAQLITCSCLIVTTFLAIIAFFEVGLNNIPVSIQLFRWIDSESLNVLWGFHFDSLTISMLIPVLIVSCLVHVYSIGYMSHDPHNQRFFSYLSLFTFMMIILVTANNFLLMFVGWEGVGVCSYLLVSFWFTRIAANQSSMSAFLTNRVGDCFLTIGMFAILWSFGNNQKMFKDLNTNRLNYNTDSLAYRQMRHYSCNSCFDHKACYLAGLIEGNGDIVVHDKNSKSKVYYPKIIIVLNIHDRPLAEKLSVELKVGKVINKYSAGHVLLEILAKKEVLKIINLINGHMRTPKIQPLHKAISWINENNNSSIPYLGLDTSSLDSNSWLAGFTDANGNFSITVYNRKKNSKIVKTNVETFFRIKVKQNYSRDLSADQGGASYFSIMTKIAEFLTVNLYTRTRSVDDKVYYVFMAISHNSKSHYLLRNYFYRFPLYSFKYLAYKDWCQVKDLYKEIPLSKKGLNEIKAIKDQFNSKRKVYDFSHLDSLTF